MTTVEKISYQGWPNCLRLSNGTIDLIATSDVGPRIIRFGFVGQENEFAEFPAQMGKTGGGEWRLYGGHRLWRAPEMVPETYAPDNAPVAVETAADAITLTQDVEAGTGIRKRMSIQMAVGKASVRVTHRLENHNPGPIELAPWALSAMATGGEAILPLPPRGSHEENLQPTSGLTFWVYTDMTDPRWSWGRRFIRLRQDPSCAAAQKLGALAPDGWLAYWRAGHLFVTRFTPIPGAPYPDLGASVELYTDANLLELETLGPMTRLAPGETVEHVEEWRLNADVPEPVNEEIIEHAILPLIRAEFGQL